MTGFEWKDKAFKPQKCYMNTLRVKRDLLFLDSETEEIIEKYPARLVPWGLFERCNWLYDFVDKILDIDPSCVVAVVPEKIVVDDKRYVATVVIVDSEKFIPRGYEI